MPPSRKLQFLLEPLARLHRWLGIAVGLMVALWFFSGTVLSFQPFPSLSAAAQRAAAAPIDFAVLRVTPAQALAAAGDADVQRLRLLSVDSRPRYLLTTASRQLLAVDAATGALLQPVDAAAARRIAERFSGRVAQSVEGPIEVDRWTVHDRYVPLRPFWRVALDDGEGTQLYVSQRSGEIAQRTRGSERAWNTVGALLHWLNIGTLRRHFELWHATIFTVASAALLLLVLGLVLGVARWRAARQLPRARHSPFRGLLRLHHLLGFIGALLIGNWLLSGWLSLDQGLFFASDQPDARQLAALRGTTLRDALRDAPLPQANNSDVREIEWRVLGGRLVAASQPAPSPAELLPDELLLRAVDAAWPGARSLRIESVAADDAYLLRDGALAPSVRRIVVEAPAPTWVHIDAASGEILSVMDDSRRRYRWWVDGLHHLDFPALNRRGQAWHVLLVMGTLAGLLFSATGLALALRRLRRLRR